MLVEKTVCDRCGRVMEEKHFRSSFIAAPITIYASSVWVNETNITLGKESEKGGLHRLDFCDEFCMSTWFKDNSPTRSPSDKSDVA